MGKRRVRNLLHYKIDRAHIFGFDPTADRRDEVAKEWGIKVYGDFEKAIEEVKPDVLIISTPPIQHHPYFLWAASHKKHFFVEVTTREDGYQDLFPLLDGTFVAAPSCTFRYFPAVKKIKELVAGGVIGKPLCFNHYLGQYLPDWHPYEDYRQVYFAKKDTGGCREMFPYELVWLTDIFRSEVKNITGVNKKISDLDITADDLYCVIAEFKNGVVGNMMIDLLNRKAARSLKIIGTLGTLDWCWLENKIKIFTAQDKKEQLFEVVAGEKIGQYNTSESAYQEEIGIFLSAIEKKINYPYTFEEDLNILSSLKFVKDIV